MDPFTFTIFLVQFAIVLATITLPVLAAMFLVRRITKSAKKTYRAIRN